MPLLSYVHIKGNALPASLTGIVKIRTCILYLTFLHQIPTLPRKKISSAPALCALALRYAPGPALQAAALECLLNCFLAQ